MLSVIIPYYNKYELTSACVDSFIKYNPNLDYEIILIDNNSDLQTVEKINSTYGKIKNMHLVSFPYPFNFQKINNWGVGISHGDILYFLNNDTQFVEQSIGLMEKMIAKSKESDIGAVGSLMVYEDNETIQHAGVYLRPEPNADHIFMGRKMSDLQNDSSIEKEYNYFTDRQVTGVTAAGLMVEKKKFLEIGGFQEKFIVCSGDIDLCINLYLAGYKTWYIGSHYILHKESQSRKGSLIPISDFTEGYKSYSRIYDDEKGDLFTPIKYTSI